MLWLSCWNTNKNTHSLASSASLLNSRFKTHAHTPGFICLFDRSLQFQQCEEREPCPVQRVQLHQGDSSQQSLVHQDVLEMLQTDRKEWRWRFKATVRQTEWTPEGEFKLCPISALVVVSQTCCPPWSTALCYNYCVQTFQQRWFRTQPGQSISPWSISLSVSYKLAHLSGIKRHCNFWTTSHVFFPRTL